MGALVFAWFWLAADAGTVRLGPLDVAALPEASGVVASRRHPGVFWAHNDSGNRPELFALRADGTILRTYRVGAPNVDWEDIACDDAGHLYLGDIGNNGGRLPIRVIHELDEPDPLKAPATDEPLRTNRSWFYTFGPGSTRFDAEALVIDGRRAVLISKRRDRRAAELFAVGLEAAAPLTRPVRPELIGALPDEVEPVTGADLSPDGRLLAVCSTTAVRVYHRPAPGETWSLAATVPHTIRGAEGIAWDGRDLVIVAENDAMYRLTPPLASAARP